MLVQILLLPYRRKMAKDSKIPNSLKLTRAVESVRGHGPTLPGRVISSEQTANAKASSITRSKKGEIKFANSATALRRLVEEASKADKPIMTAVRLRPFAAIRTISPDKLDEDRDQAPKNRHSPSSLPSVAPKPTASQGTPPTVVNEPRAITTVLALGDVVRHARRRRGLSQAELALAAGTGRRFISDLEAGKPTLEFERLLKVCHSLGITLFASERA